MIMIPPRHYCIISNPIARNEKGERIKDVNGQAKLRHGDEEIRFEQDPFALFPGEKLVGKVSPLQVVAPDTALKVRCIRDFKDDKGTLRKAGDEWLYGGPGTYSPRIEVSVTEVVRAIIVKPNQAIKLRAKKKLWIKQKRKDKQEKNGYTEKQDLSFQELMKKLLKQSLHLFLPIRKHFI
jgi:major vault protein